MAVQASSRSVGWRALSVERAYNSGYTPGFGSKLEPYPRLDLTSRGRSAAASAVGALVVSTNVARRLALGAEGW